MPFSFCVSLRSRIVCVALLNVLVVIDSDKATHHHLQMLFSGLYWFLSAYVRIDVNKVERLFMYAVIILVTACFHCIFH